MLENHFLIQKVQRCPEMTHRILPYHSVCILGVEVVPLIQNILTIDCSLASSRISILPGKTNIP